ncbi:MAG: hypothetical protein WA962_04675, partial [Ornithinimicrobium sp.]
IEPSTGRVATASGTIDVADPDVTFAGAGTAYVSETGDFSDCPPSIAANRQFTSLNAAKEDMANRVSGARVMLARGQDFVMAGGGDNISVVRGSTPFHFVAGPGTKAKPRVLIPAGDTYCVVWYDYKGDEYVVSEIDLQGPWDSTTESGGQTGEYKLFGWQTKYLFNSCNFNGINGWIAYSSPRGPADGEGRPAGMTEAEAIRQNGVHTSFIANNCRNTNANNYCLYAEGMSRLAVLGTQMAHESDARSGGDYRYREGVEPPNANHSGSVRVAGSAPVEMVVDGADMFSRCGWFQNEGVPWKTIQPCLRFNTSVADGFFLNVQRSSFEGGGSMVVVSRENGGRPLGVSPLLLEHCIFTPSHMTATGIQLMGGNAAIRSVLVNVPDVAPVTGDFEFRRFVQASYEANNGDYPEVFLSKLEVTGVTLIDHRSAANRSNQGTELLSLFDPQSPDPNPYPRGPVVYENNIIHTPNISDPNGLSGFDEASTQSGPLDDTPLWAPREIFGPIVSYLEYKGTYPARYHRGDTITLPHPPGTDASTFTAPGAPNPKSWAIDGPASTIEHLSNGIRITNVSAGIDREAGDNFTFELDLGDNPARYPQYASPLDSVWSGTPLAGSSAIGAASTDDVPYEDLRMRVRPVHPSVGAVE